MSIILDALKKAETDRQMGQLPGLHTPRSTTNASQSVPVGLRTRWVLYAVAGGVVLVASAAAWWVASTEYVSTPAVALRGQSQPSPIRSVPTVQSAPAESPAQSLPRVESAAAAREIPVPPPLPTSVAKPVPAVAAKPAPPAAVVRDVQSKPATAAVAPAAEFVPVPAPAPAPTAGKIMMMAELSPALQRELPPLAIGGSMYSDKASERMLLIDKRLLHEGDEVAPNLVLEKLMPKEAILRFRGTRFRIAF